MCLIEKILCKKDNSISFLIGAGFSAPIGYPTGAQLNKKILNCINDNFAFSADGSLIISNDGTKPDLGYKTQYDWYFEFCYDLIHYYNNYIKEFDYEEFYDYLKLNANKDTQLADYFYSKQYDGGRAEFENYLFQIDNIFNQVISFYLKDKFGRNQYGDVGFYLKHSFEGYTGFLNCIEEFLKNHVIHIHTLNHDLFFERLNRTEWINGELCDGFEELGSPYYGELIYNNQKYKCRLERYTGNYAKKLRLYKLHGSKDYYLYYRTKEGNFVPEIYLKNKWGIGSSDLYKEKRGENRKLEYEQCWVNYHSDFLTGTTSKIIRYREPLLFSKLFKLFEDNLKKSDMLIIIGYGCKDSEINRIISECFGRKKPCYIVDPFAGEKVREFKNQMGDNTKLITNTLEYLTINDFQ